MPTVNCPTCKKSMEWDSNNPNRPFCCERCRLIDLGAWANEEYQISKPSGNDLKSQLEIDPEMAEEMLLEMEQQLNNGESSLH